MEAFEGGAAQVVGGVETMEGAEVSEEGLVFGEVAVGVRGGAVLGCFDLVFGEFDFVV